MRPQNRKWMSILSRQCKIYWKEKSDTMNYKYWPVLRKPSVPPTTYKWKMEESWRKNWLKVLMTWVCWPIPFQLPSIPLRNPDELINWAVGHPPPTYSNQAVRNHPIAGGSQLNPVVESPVSPPLFDQMQFFSAKINNNMNKMTTIVYITRISLVYQSQRSLPAGSPTTRITQDVWYAASISPKLEKKPVWAILKDHTSDY